MKMFRIGELTLTNRGDGRLYMAKDGREVSSGLKALDEMLGIVEAGCLLAGGRLTQDVWVRVEDQAGQGWSVRIDVTGDQILLCPVGHGSGSLLMSLTEAQELASKAWKPLVGL